MYRLGDLDSFNTNEVNYNLDNTAHWMWYNFDLGYLDSAYQMVEVKQFYAIR